MLTKITIKLWLKKNPTDNEIKKELNKLKKLYEYGLITKKVLEEKQKEILK